MRVLAFIPARSGSKGLPDKNIRPLGGRPLLEWSIRAAKDSGVCDEIFVSTDSQTYANLAIQSGACVPFLRPEHLASDTAPTTGAILDALANFQSKGVVFDTLLLLQPTSPLRSAEDIRKALNLFVQRQAKSIVSVCQVDHSPLWCNTLPEDGCLAGFIKEETMDMTRQQLPTYYRINGAIYVSQVQALKASESLYGPQSYAYVMSPERSIDIDTMFDFRIAEMLLGMQ